MAQRLAVEPAPSSVTGGTPPLDVGNSPSRVVQTHPIVAAVASPVRRIGPPGAAPSNEADAPEQSRPRPIVRREIGVAPREAAPPLREAAGPQQRVAWGARQANANAAEAPLALVPRPPASGTPHMFYFITIIIACFNHNEPSAMDTRNRWCCIWCFMYLIVVLVDFCILSRLDLRFHGVLPEIVPASSFDGAEARRERRRKAFEGRTSARANFEHLESSEARASWLIWAAYNWRKRWLPFMSMMFFGGALGAILVFLTIPQMALYLGQPRNDAQFCTVLGKPNATASCVLVQLLSRVQFCVPNATLGLPAPTAVGVEVSCYYPHGQTLTSANIRALPHARPSRPQACVPPGCQAPECMWGALPY